jgi:hypothetical protein
MRARLVVRGVDGVEVAVLQRDEHGVITIVSAAERIRPELTQWLTLGLSELQGDPANPRRRRTRPGEPELLDRIAALYRNYGFLATSVLTETASADSVLQIDNAPRNARSDFGGDPCCTKPPRIDCARPPARAPMSRGLHSPMVRATTSRGPG